MWKRSTFMLHNNVKIVDLLIAYSIIVTTFIYDITQSDVKIFFDNKKKIISLAKHFSLRVSVLKLIKSAMQWNNTIKLNWLNLR